MNNLIKFIKINNDNSLLKICKKIKKSKHAKFFLEISLINILKILKNCKIEQCDICREEKYVFKCSCSLKSCSQCIINYERYCKLDYKCPQRCTKTNNNINLIRMINKFHPVVCNQINDHQSLLSYACDKNIYKIVKLLLKIPGIDVNNSRVFKNFMINRFNRFNENNFNYDDSESLLFKDNIEWDTPLHKTKNCKILTLLLKQPDINVNILNKSCESIACNIIASKNTKLMKIFFKKTVFNFLKDIKYNKRLKNIKNKINNKKTNILKGINKWNSLNEEVYEKFLININGYKQTEVIYKNKEKYNEISCLTYFDKDKECNDILYNKNEMKNSVIKKESTNIDPLLIFIIRYNVKVYFKKFLDISNLRTVDQYKRNALHWAIIERKEFYIKELLQDPRITDDIKYLMKDKEKKSAWDYANDYGFTEYFNIFTNTHS